MKFLALVLAAAVSAAAAPPREAFIASVGAIVHKPVLWHPWQADFDGVPVPKTRADLDRSPFRVIEKEDWAYVVRRSIVYPYDAKMPQWMRVRARDFHLNLGFYNFHDDAPDSLSEAEMRRAGAVVLREARLVPSRSYDPDPTADDGRIPLELLFARSGDFVVALIRADPRAESGRIAFGRYTAGKFTLLWDSPLVHARNADVLFVDVDGDTVPELALRSDSLEMPKRQLLTIFDAHGNELTRRAQCLPLSADDTDPDEAKACPIAATEVRLDRRNSHVDVLATTGTTTTRYTLYRGRYVQSKSVSP